MADLTLQQRAARCVIDAIVARQCDGGRPLESIIADAIRDAEARGAAREREECARLMEGTPPPGKPGWAGGDYFCRAADHAQGNCECAERADAIRRRADQ